MIFNCTVVGIHADVGWGMCLQILHYPVEV